jgi:Tfp pilus assembly protein PilF
MSPEERAEHHLQRGLEFLVEGDRNAAWIEFNNAIQSNPKNVEANLQLAAFSERDGKLKEATFYLREAYDADPSNSIALSGLALSLLDSDPLGALEILRRGIADQPDNPTYYLALSQVLLVINQLDESIEAARAALELDSEIPGPYWQLAISYEAKIFYALRDQRFPDGDAITAGVEALDHFLEKGGEPRWKAQLEQSRILWTHPAHRPLALQKAREALSSARTMDEDYPKQIAAKHLSNLARTQNDKSAYADALEVVLESNPRDFLAWRNFAELRENSGGSAKKVYITLLSLLPTHPRAHIEYSRYLSQTVGYYKTVKYFNDQIKNGIQPDHLLYALRELQLTARIPKSGGETLKRMNEEYPNSAWTQLANAKEEAQAGNTRAARTRVEEILASEAIPEAYELLATIEEFDENRTAAIAAMRGAIDSYDGVHPKFLSRLAALQFEEKEYQDHIRTLETVTGRVSLSQREKLDLAISYYGTGNSAEGLLLLLELIGDPEVADAATLRLYSLERSNLSLRPYLRQHLRAGLVRNSGSKEFIIPLVNLAIEENQSAAALKMLNKLDLREIKGDIRFVRAKLRLEYGDRDGALADAELALLDDPAAPGLIEFCAALYSSSGKSKEAIEKIEFRTQYLRSRLAKDWLGVSRRIALLNILHARVLQSSGRIEEGVAVLEKAIADLEYVFDTKIDLAYMMAWTEDRRQEAVEIASAATSKRPRDPRAIDTLGFTYLKMERWDEALQQFRRASRVAKNSSPLIRYHESVALQNLGRTTEALVAIEAVLAIDPEYPRAKEFQEMLQTDLGNRGSKKTS